MNEIIEGYTGKFIKKHRKRRKYISIFIALALVVASGVVWQMKLTGISMNADVMCGKEEHQHDETCYEKILICGHADSGQSGNVSEEGHKHTDACYETRLNCVCAQPEHQHKEACYDENGQFICETAEHQHSELCYVTESVQICGQEEAAGLSAADLGAAGSDAASAHVHTDACYEERLVCGKEEHTHTIACMSDKNADLESEADWKATLPSELSHKWTEDLLAVANSQLGYQESTRNFILDEDGERTRGYTRYGQWYGSPYGDWCAMFVSWCLHYAEIPEEAVPYAAGCYAWTIELEEMGVYHTADEYAPEAGDLIFFYSGDGINHVGIVESVDEEKEIIHTIEGNAGDVVCKNEYKPADKSIAGYGSLKEAEKLYEIRHRGELPERTVVAELYTDESYTERIEEDVITVSGKIPAGAQIKAYPVSTELEGKQILAAYDITIFLQDDTIYEPETPLEVVLKLPKMEKTVETRRISVYYVPDAPEEKAERISSDIHEMNVEFRANHFSVYALVLAENEIEIGSEAELMNRLKTGGDFILTNDITLTNAFQTIALKNGWTGTLDLNGYTITCVNGKSLFDIENGTSLTIKDSKKKEEQTVSPSPDGASYGNVAVHDNDTLTYYVTESEVTQPAVGATAETLVKHTVPIAGGIKGANAPIIMMKGGSFTLESGMLYDGTNRAFEVSGGTLNLQGGYVFGFKKEENGGAALISGSTIVNLSGSVLAGNASTGKAEGKGCGGAIAAVGHTVLNMTGGVISGNRADGVGKWEGNNQCGGGGIYCKDAAAVNMSGGYLTNNRADSDGEHYFDGGGGIFLSGTSELTLNDGYITGNISPGGSGVRTDWQKSTHFTMNGGFVSGNYAASTEGGGIAVTSHGVGYINGGYITNNITNTQIHWGGGGLFCSDGAYLYVKNVIVMENQAGGFGGGVAGCSTGRVYICVKEGGAIYENSAAGENMSGNGSEKREDIEYGKNSPVFMENGFADYFCALNSLVEGSMLGGAPAKWAGSYDGIVVTDVPGDMTLEAAYVMGLTAHPTQQGIHAALTPGLANVFVNGNSSYTHGGGILCNGYLLIGDKNPIAVGSRFKLSGTKRLQNNGANMSLEGYEFKFSVKNENGEVVSAGTSDKDGKINFDRLISFSEELCKTKIQTNGQSAVFTYYLTEDDRQENLDVAIDSAQYKISVTVKREDSTIPMVDAEGNQIIKTYYKITGVKVQKSTDAGKTWRDIAYTWNPSNDEQHAGNLEITNGTTFTNQKKKTVSLNVEKKWPTGDNPPKLIMVDLKRDGKVVDTVELNKENGWSYTWSNLAEGYEYTVYEHLVPGYEATYTTAGNSGTESTITITNKKVSKLYDLEITKVSDVNHDETLPGAEFEFSKDGETLTFTKDKNGVYIYDENGTAVLVTDANGKIKIDKLPEGDYVLKETKAPAGYEVTEEKHITLGGDEKITVKITVEDKKIEYILPESGGPGIIFYLLSGVILMFVSILGVIKKRA